MKPYLDGRVPQCQDTGLSYLIRKHRTACVALGALIDGDDKEKIHAQQLLVRDIENQFVGHVSGGMMIVQLANDQHHKDKSDALHAGLEG